MRKTEKATARKISKRTSLRPLTKRDVVDYYGKRELENMMARLKWVKIGDESSKELDQRTVDYSYGVHHARIDIQLKTSNESRSRRFRGWVWKIFRLKKKLDMDFYGERHNFLALVGFHIYEINSEFSEPENIKIALIPVSEVVRHFDAITSSTHNIIISRSTLESNKELKWRRFFGLANIKETLARELELQEREYRHSVVLG